jgi:hypothetical protein
LSSSPPGEYTDEFPIRGVTAFNSDKPPYLPPQLLNIVLNKDTAAKVITFLLEISQLVYAVLLIFIFAIVFQCEPSLLPEPNHVMLKHLYALSIRVKINK